MAFLNPFIWANRNGIPRLEADTATISTTAVTYNFRGLFRAVPFSGLVLFKLPSFTAPATAVPIVFNAGGNTATLTTFGGEEVLSSADLASGGIILTYCEGNTIQLLSVLTI